MSGAETPLSLDLSRVPLSRAGSYLTLAHLSATDTRPDGLYLRSVRGYTDHQSLLLIEPTRSGRPVKVTESAAPTMVRLDAGGGAQVELAFDGPDSVRVRARGGLGVRLRVVYPRSDDAFAVSQGRWVFNIASNNIKLMLAPLRGRVTSIGRASHAKELSFDLLPDANGELEASLDEFRSTWVEPRRPPWPELVANLERELAAWKAGLPPVPPALGATGDVAGFLLWSNRVGPGLLLPRTATFSTKNTLVGDWGWDHCFHAMPLAQRNPAAAWDEFMVVLDAQDRFGALPDRINDTMRLFDFTKPPVHGWALRWMMQQNAVLRDPRRLTEAYGPLVRWTNWWFSHRDEDGDGIPEYQGGNDSGWDNATPFLLGHPLESPDLSAYLIVQMDVLADVARRIGRGGESRAWRRRADVLFGKLMSTMWKGDRFVAGLSGSDRTSDADSLLLWIPLILGDRLPPEARRSLVEGVKRRFVTAHGVATENPKSPHYEGDGYWRGPVWGPSTLLIVDGLLASGGRDVALDIARGYTSSLQGTFMPENFDALTGAPRKDTAFSWTSAAYLILANLLVPSPSTPR